MKKIQILLLFICTATFSMAQVAVIPRVGINITNVSFDNNTWADRKELVGITGGLGLNYNLSADGFLYSLNYFIHKKDLPI